MKRAAPNHPKMKTLAAALGIPLAHANGIMERLWHWAAQFSPQGDIGRWSNETIAEELTWDVKDANHIVGALITSNWCDPHDTHRIVLHDWYEHAEDSIHMYLARKGLLFATGEVPRMNRLSEKERTSLIKKHYNSKICAHKKRTKSAQKAHNVRTALCLMPYANASYNTPLDPPVGGVNGFDRFWSVYPRKVDKQTAYRAWGKIKPDETLTMAIIASVEAHKATRQWQRDDGEAIPYPATYLNKRRWQDVLQTEIPTAPSKGVFRGKTDYGADVEVIKG